MRRKLTMKTLDVWDAGDDPGPIPPRDSDPRWQLAKLLTIKARDLDRPPSYEAGNEVKNRHGELSSPIYWQGRQWAVTEYGVEARDGTYPIEKERLWKEEKVHGWVRHMAEKGWVDLPDFAEALRIARRRWR
jgi:hypothetical protein